MRPDPRTHDLERLLEAVSPGLSSVETLTRDCTLLTDFGVAPRYPGWEPVSGVIELVEVLVAARRMLDWARVVAVTPHPPNEQAVQRRP